MHDPTELWAGLTPKQAMALQREAASRVVTEDDLPEVTTVAGVDVGFEDRDTARAGVVVLRLADLAPIDYAIAGRPVPLPYIPGLLSFRECPAIFQALSQLERQPDLLLCDGHGIAHPRRLGVASHLGLLTGLPTIGVAKKALLGTHGTVPDRRGAWTPLVDDGEEIGAVLRTRAGVKPVFVSCGHRISLGTAVDHVMACTTRYRLPEAIRWADALASKRNHSWWRQLDEMCSAYRPAE